MADIKKGFVFGIAVLFLVVFGLVVIADTTDNALPVSDFEEYSTLPDIGYTSYTNDADDEIIKDNEGNYYLKYKTELGDPYYRKVEVKDGSYYPLDGNDNIYYLRPDGFERYSGNQAPSETPSTNDNDGAGDTNPVTQDDNPSKTTTKTMPYAEYLRSIYGSSTSVERSRIMNDDGDPQNMVQGNDKIFDQLSNKDKEHFRKGEFDQISSEGLQVLEDNQAKIADGASRAQSEYKSAVKEGLKDALAEAFITPSMGAREIGGWLQEKIFGKKDMTENWKKYDPNGGNSFGQFLWFKAFDPVNAIADAFCTGRKGPSSYFEQQGPNYYSGGSEWPSISAYSMLFIYGMKQEFVDKEGNPAHLWPGGETWFPDANSQPLGYLYTISWNFVHPYTQEEVDGMSERRRENLNLGKSSGNIYFRIVTMFEDGEYKRGMMHNVSPGTPAKGTASFYSTDEIEHVYFKFINNYKHQNHERFPQDGKCVPDTNMGCIKTVETNNYGKPVVVQTDESGQVTTQTNAVTTGGVPVGGGYTSGSGGGSDEDPCGDYGCLF